jgi:hypothetical protein
VENDMSRTNDTKDIHKELNLTPYKLLLKVKTICNKVKCQPLDDDDDDDDDDVSEANLHQVQLY